MARAGVAQWPELFVNLRASRETKLMRTEPARIVHEWLGNSKEVAEDHYLVVTDEDFDRAKDRSANGTSAGDGRAGRITRSYLRSPSGDGSSGSPRCARG